MFQINRDRLPLKRRTDKKWMQELAGCLLRGRYRTRLLDPFGNPIRDWIEFPNGATYEGMNYLLDAGFRGQSQLSSWYFVVISGSGFTAVSVNDTAASHAWSEFTTYSEANRQQWSPAAASNGVVVNTAATITISSGGSIKGMSVQSNSTKGSGSGKLASTAELAAADTVTASQTYQIVYEADLTPIS